MAYWTQRWMSDMLSGPARPDSGKELQSSTVTGRMWPSASSFLEKTVTSLRSQSVGVATVTKDQFSGGEVVLPDLEQFRQCLEMARAGCEVEHGVGEGGAGALVSDCEARPAPPPATPQTIRHKLGSF